MNIIQVSPPHTGSTVLVNLVVEFFEKGNSVFFTEDFFLPKDRIVVKSHNINLDLWLEKFPEEPLYFIMSVRDGDDYMQIDSKYRNWPNVLIFNYNEIVVSDSLTVKSISENVHKKIINFIDFLGSSPKDLENRFIQMNERYEEIKNKPFSYIDSYYGLHGSHKGREPLTSSEMNYHRFKK